MMNALQMCFPAREHYKCMTKFYNTVLFSTLLCIALNFSYGCKTQIIAPKSNAVDTGIKTILVMPFKSISSVYKDADENHCPLCGKTFMTGSIPDNAVTYMTDRLIDLIGMLNDYHFIFAKHNQPDWSASGSKPEPIVSERNFLIESGKGQHADAVLSGYIYRFKQRVGTTYSVESPASVAFGMHIVRVPDGRILWSGHFDETQHSLSENLLQLGIFLKRKASWVTAEQMASSGLEDILNTLKTP